ncbi:hypothetical protein GW915_00700 [bacterium]|nr:hypothetical protein [bacterium]
MRFITVIPSTLLFLSWLATAEPEMQLEHSFQADGSSWGTDDDFRKALTLPEEQIPELFKTQIPKRNVTVADVRDVELAKGRFQNNKAYLYKGDIRLCISSNLPEPNKSFQEAVETFLDNVSAVAKEERPFGLKTVVVNEETDLASKCDLYIKRGSWDQFPYRYLPDGGPKNQKSVLEKVYGLYYRWNDTALPVVTLHPELIFSYDPPKSLYVSQQGAKTYVDARVLFLHEVGHFLGFNHIEPDSSGFAFPEATVMGVHHEDRDERALSLRFKYAKNLWRYWDAYQTTIYRRVYMREMSETCQLPPPVDFRPLPGGALDAAIEKINSEIEREQPWGAFKVTKEMLLKAVTTRKLWDMEPVFCPQAQSVYRNIVSELSELKFFSSLSDGKRSFQVNLTFRHPEINWGYGLRIGDLVIEGGGSEKI